MDIDNIKKKPEVYNGVHESIYKCYSILEKVIDMLERDDSTQTILEIIYYLSKKQ